MKNYKGIAVVGMLLAICAFSYSPSIGNKDGPRQQAKLHSTKYTAHFTTTPGISIIQLATAETAVSFERPATKSILLVPAPLRKAYRYSSIVVRNNGPPKA